MRVSVDALRARLTPAARRRLSDYLQLARLDRPIGIGLLLWPTLWALWVASRGRPSLALLAIFVAGTVLMRSAGCVINDFFDRNIDPYVRRTRWRPLAARRRSPWEALVFAAALGLLALLLALQLNAAAQRLAWIGAAIAVSYPLFKRFFAIPQLYLGVAFGWGVPMAFAAELGAVPRAGWLMLVAAVLWAGVYDTWYAMMDRADDARLGVKSSALLFGDLDLLMIGIMQLMMLITLLLMGRVLALSPIYYSALAVGAGCFVWQQWRAHGRDVAGCLRAFRNNNYFGLIVLGGLILEYAVRR
ncbi:MAG: 4-hydroxybenzoate octaprenyltransferase [Gammaproteobacteria bacterium]|nr:4-hydroxybenzoate octaprenyltransferase [Gammaproteobacteria bacterium]